MKRILLIKTSSLGDVIHNCPVIHDIRRHFPDAQIDWVVEENFADIPRLHTGVNQVFTVAMRRWRKQLFNKKTWQEISQFKQQIQHNQYDSVIDTQGLLKSALITKLANGVKHGYDKNSIREPLASYFYGVTHACSYQPVSYTHLDVYKRQASGGLVCQSAHTSSNEVISPRSCVIMKDCCVAGLLPCTP